MSATPALVSDVDALIRPFALGLATGARTTVGLAAVSLMQGGKAGSVGRALTSTWGRRITPVLAVGELAADKLPTTPSRLGAAGLSSRLTVAALGGLALAERDGADPLATAVFAVAGAGLGTVLGAGLRSAARSRTIPDLPVALLEDLLAAALAFVGVAGARSYAD